MSGNKQNQRLDTPDMCQMNSKPQLQKEACLTSHLPNNVNLAYSSMESQMSGELLHGQPTESPWRVAVDFRDTEEVTDILSGSSDEDSQWEDDEQEDIHKVS